MFKHAHAFIQSAAESFNLRGPIYEFGFTSPTMIAEVGTMAETGYIDCDPCDATEIDRLDDLARLPFPDGSARTVICVNSLEHVFEPHRAMAEMIRILAPGGLLLVCSPSSHETHDDADRYWQLTPRALGRLMEPLEATLVGWQGPDRFAHTLFGIGCKPPDTVSFAAGVNQFLDCFQRRLDQANVRSRWTGRLKDFLIGWRKSKSERHRQRDRDKTRFILHLPAGQQLKHQLLASCLPRKNTGARLDLSQ